MLPKFNLILLVDDDEVCNYVSSEIITDMALSTKIDAVKDGTEAVAFLSNLKKEEIQNFLILLDLNMPTMNGFEFLDYLNNNFPERRRDIKVIVLTSSSNGQDMENLRARKINGFIVKPLTEKKLEDVIRML